MRRHALFGVALLLDLVGTGGALLLASRPWQTVTAERAAPFPSIRADVTGRTLDAAPTALALVALAGVVAVLATRGLARRVVGAVIALAGAGLIWRAIVSAGAVASGRARDLLGPPYSDVGFPLVAQAEAHPVWPALTGVCGLLVAVSGVLIAWFGHRWQTMSKKYEPAPARESDPARTAATLWSKLDRGEDPTD
jgi:uncharacterized membrane protein (TIGR02234 family)